MAFSSSNAFFASSHLPSAPKIVPQTDFQTFPSPRIRMITHEQSHSLHLQDIQHEHILLEVKNMFRNLGEDSIEGLNLIDGVLRLGIDYHFQEEIATLLRKQYMKSNTYGDYNQNLDEVSLRFRLLRQQGYLVPADVFMNYKNKEGMFKKELTNDLNGLMGLYEASQLSIGEEILEDAGEFSSKILNAWTQYLDPHQATIVANTLRQPYHMSLPCFTTKNFRGIDRWSNILLHFSKLESSKVKSLHQQEVNQISKWWKELGLAKELKFARDQPLKWYMWPMAMLTDPRLTEERIELTKPISLIYIIDDIFDIYGTLDQLTLFTNVVNRWELSDVDPLPDTMRICFKALDLVTNEISNKVYKQHGWDPRDYLKKAWATLCNAFLLEARWFAAGKYPRAEEYLNNGIISSGVHVVLVHIFFLLGQNVKNETVYLVNHNNPPIISSVATILRLWDDLGSSQDENQNGHDGSYIDYFIKEHEECTIETARAHVRHKISDEWKILNKECLSSKAFPASFTKASLNLARMVPLMYNYDENHQLTCLEEHMKSLMHA